MARASSGFFNADEVRAAEFGGKYLHRSTFIPDNFQIGADFPSFIYLRASAARDILMPPEEDCDGKIYWIHNLSTATARILTVKTSSDAALSPAVTIGMGAAVALQSVMGVWKAIS